MSTQRIIVVILVLAVMIVPSCSPNEIPDLRALISQDQLFAYLEDLTAIQPRSGWRSSGTEGEAEAFDYVAGTLSEFTHLQDLGMELERQSYRVFLATEIWESRLFLTIDGQENEVPTNAISGHRQEIVQALHFDSDGTLNDADRNPVEATGSVLALRSINDITDHLEQDDVHGKIVFVDNVAVDPAVQIPGVGARLVSSLIQKDIAGLVLVTDDGYGKGVGDGTSFDGIAADGIVPMLYVTMEDLALVGIDSWEELTQIEAARLIWDTDVFSPGESGNLVARIPGTDSSRAIVLGAHIDSANTPGAGDNGINCAVLLEVARVLNEGAVHPPVDVYMVWLGSHEIGLYGSQHFVNTHQELLDRTIAALLLDGFTAYKSGPTIFAMQEADHARFGNDELPFTDYLAQKAEDYEIPIDLIVNSGPFSSDDGPFYGFVPHARFAYGNERIGWGFHSPYDTLENVRDQGGTMEKSVVMALVAALQVPRDVPDLRVTPEPERRALFIATHTEVLHMTPPMFIALDRTLAWEGFDVDVIPYGHSPTAEDLADADLVLALPVIDYPSADGDLTLYDEAWSAQEIDLLATYVEQGGLLILTNSANRLYMGQVFEANEDWDKVNALAAPFGINYENIPSASIASIASDHPLTENLTSLFSIPDNGMAFRMQAGQTLAEMQGKVALGLVDYGEAGGQVLAMADIGMLDLYDSRGRDINNFSPQDRNNFVFLRNLVRYARDR